MWLVVRSLWSQLITWLSFAINIVMLATWNARASLADTPLYKNDTAIPPQLAEYIPPPSRLLIIQLDASSLAAIYVILNQGRLTLPSLTPPTTGGRTLPPHPTL